MPNGNDSVQCFRMEDSILELAQVSVSGLTMEILLVCFCRLIAEFIAIYHSEADKIQTMLRCCADIAMVNVSVSRSYCIF